MTKTIEQHILNMSSSDNAVNNRTQIDLVASKLTQDPNLIVKAQGEILVGVIVTLDGSISSHVSTQAAAETATKVLAEDNKKATVAYNLAAQKVEEIYPNNPTKYSSFGYAVSSPIAQDQTLADKVVNGSISQGEFPKECLVRFDVSARADNYTLQITIADPSDLTKYILVVNPKMIFTTAKISFFVPDDYLGKNLWVKVTAHNSAGTSPASDAFGGLKIQ